LVSGQQHRERQQLWQGAMSGPLRESAVEEISGESLVLWEIEEMPTYGRAKRQRGNLGC
jgi:hypothetical protein